MRGHAIGRIGAPASVRCACATALARLICGDDTGATALAWFGDIVFRSVQ